MSHAHPVNIAPVKNNGDEFNRHWRQANERVRAAEEKVQKAWADFAAGRADPPLPELMEEVARLRREADAELSKLLANIQISRRVGPDPHER